eukprot:Protomagalhaensia_sp_Gyna_25__178@NODE_1087_length_2203_cov_584_896950_g384_i2_p2_GENE_NODE_1087_length_2203_cov_584_896950_g384_i2NODE_1087_length_2203_cov_584_896950_g384_i2_p2_ORF_typecomplete_len250_score82_93EF1_GNE/PF00736_19/7_7e03EF1_GNE/PF00736_19/1_8e19Stm1_N/PF09598_10/1_8e04Stm1_N/PF09598_10/2_4_NODE_1087_length_2203_cov_584_896950_g384_i278827
MAVEFGNLKSDAGLSTLNTHMLKHSYVEGCCPSTQDAVTYSKLVGVPNANKFPAAARWYRHIASYTEGERDAWSIQAVPATSEGAHGAPPKAVDEDDVDLFGDDGEEEKVDLAEAMKKLADKKAAESEKKKKAAPVAKSTVTLKISPTSSDIDLNELAQKIRSIEIEGLTWTVKWEIEKLYFGLSALIIGCVIVDDLVPTENIVRSVMCVGLSPEMAAARNEALDMGVEFDEEDECLVKSCQIASFSKL